jgi:hypothetical protein
MKNPENLDVNELIEVPINEHIVIFLQNANTQAPQWQDFIFNQHSCIQSLSIKYS